MDEAVAGDIIAVAKLKDTHTFDTLCEPGKEMVFEPVELPGADLAFAVGAKTRGDEEKVFEAIKRLMDEDTSLKLGVPRRRGRTSSPDWRRCTSRSRSSA